MARWIRHFSDADPSDRALLGNKGANLAGMTQLGLPVPPGFIVTTAACRYVQQTGTIPPDLWTEVDEAITAIEARMARRLGDTDNPLLLSVRSGAAESMPGMMDTILNVGITPATRAGLGRQLGDRFAADAWRRLIQMYGKVVLGAPAEWFENALSGALLATGLPSEHEFDTASLLHLAERFESLLAEHDLIIPADPREQVRQSILAVFKSWNSERAIAFRATHGLPEQSGTAATIQAMVFGNRNEQSGTGVVFTRHPGTGDPGLFGEFLINAQGEDVVAGTRTPFPISNLQDMPAWQTLPVQLQAIGDQLELHYADMQDIEFTVEDGRLWILQTRNGKRSAAAAVRIAVDLTHAGVIDRAEAVRRIQPEKIESLLHPGLDDGRPVNVIGNGLPASPGAARGVIAIDTADARKRAAEGTRVILVRAETAAEDYPAMAVSEGILTARGGMTSHAAVVARGIGKPAVTACSDLTINTRNQTITIGTVTLAVGDELAIDGGSGRVITGPVTLAPAELDAYARTILDWADEFRHLAVRANADSPEDARGARALGAEGIGLCRTEHMFFGDGRLSTIQTLILAETDDERDQALARLEQFQTDDFIGIFRAMDGFPVTIRTLDPPLHEFLPHRPANIAALAKRLNVDTETLRDRIEAHRESNPMLGLRGVRLSIVHPGIATMQARSIARAAIACIHEGIDVRPEIMVPLVSVTEELSRQREVIEKAVASIVDKSGVSITIRIGTMLELPRACLRAGRLAEYADFFSFGTNDLTQTTFGMSRDDSARYLPTYLSEGIYRTDPFQTLDQQGVGELIQMAIERARAVRPEISMGVCGEHGGDPESISFCHGIGLDYVSCSPFRVPVARLAAAHASLANPIEQPLLTAAD